MPAKKESVIKGKLIVLRDKRLEDAVDACGKALEIYPNSSTAQEHLKSTQDKLAEVAALVVRIGFESRDEFSHYAKAHSVADAKEFQSMSEYSRMVCANILLSIAKVDPDSDAFLSNIKADIAGFVVKHNFVELDMTVQPDRDLVTEFMRYRVRERALCKSEGRPEACPLPFLDARQV